MRSPYSLLRWASAAVRSCNSRYVSALPTAITACSANVCSRAIWLSVKAARCFASECDGADRHARPQQRHSDDGVKIRRLHLPCEVVTVRLRHLAV